MLDNVVILKRANRQFQSICDYLVDEFGESVVIAAFADMRMHPNKIMKIVKG